MANEVNVLLKAKDEASPDIEKVNKSVANLGDGMTKLGDGAAQVASKGLREAGEAANAFGVELGPLPGAAGAVTDALGSMNGGIGALAVAVPLAGFAIAGLVAMFLGDCLNSTAAFGTEVEKLTLQFGLSEQQAISFADGLDQFGVSSQTITAALSYFARQVEATRDATVKAEKAQAEAAVQAASQIADAHKKAAGDIAEAKDRQVQAEQEAGTKVAEIIANQKEVLGELARKHAEVAGDIRASMTESASETASKMKQIAADAQSALRDLATRHNATVSDIKSSESDLNGSYAQDAADRKESFQEQLDSMAESHEQAMARIRASNATDKQAQLDAEQAAYDKSVELAQKHEAKAEERAQQQFERQKAALAKRLADENAAYIAAEAKERERANRAVAEAQAAEDKKQAALQQRLDREDAAYARATANQLEEDEKRTRSIEAQLAKQEAATAKSIEKIEKMESDSIARIQAQQAKKSDVSAEVDPKFLGALDAVLTAAGRTKDEIAGIFQQIRDGKNVMTDDNVLDSIADGFKAMHDQGQGAASATNLAGLASSIFGRQAGIDFLPALVNGAQAFRDNRDAAGEYERALGPDWLKKLKEFRGSQDDMNDALLQMKIAIGVELMPVASSFFGWMASYVTTNRGAIVGFLKEVGERSADAGRWIGEHREDFKDFFGGVKEFGQWAIDHWQFIAFLSGTAGAIKLIGGALDLLSLNPLVLAIGAAAFVGLAVTGNLPGGRSSAPSTPQQTPLQQKQAAWDQGYNTYIGRPGAAGGANGAAEYIAKYGARPSAQGIWDVPGSRGGGDSFAALLAPGEMVVPASEAEDFRRGRGGMGGGGLVQHIHGDIHINEAQPGATKASLGIFGYAALAGMRARGMA